MHTWTITGKRHGLAVALAVFLLATGCAKRVRLEPRPIARAGLGTARVELTYNRNNVVEVKLSKVPDPAAVNPRFSRYVLWAATPDRQHVTNVGQLRVDERGRAEIRTLTPFRSFVLFVTAEPAGDVMTPGPDVVFETKEIRW